MSSVTMEEVKELLEKEKELAKEYSHKYEAEKVSIMESEENRLETMKKELQDKQSELDSLGAFSLLKKKSLSDSLDSMKLEYNRRLKEFQDHKGYCFDNINHTWSSMRKEFESNEFTKKLDAIMITELLELFDISDGPLTISEIVESNPVIKEIHSTRQDQLDQHLGFYGRNLSSTFREENQLFNKEVVGRRTVFSAK